MPANRPPGPPAQKPPETSRDPGHSTHAARPRIAIPIPTSEDDEYNERSWPLYAAAVTASGGEPIALPLDQSPEKLAKAVSACAAVLLPGSPADVNPEKYGQPAHPATSPPDRLREIADDLLLQDAHNMRKPILAICYGVQSLNVWTGGTLLQDLASAPINHAAGRNVTEAHRVAIDPGSLLANLSPGSIHAAVNSSHHQAIDTPGDGLRITARSEPDRIPEALESTRPGHFVLGVQWHPERGFAEDELAQNLFAEFIQAARQWHPRPPE